MVETIQPVVVGAIGDDSLAAVDLGAAEAMLREAPLYLLGQAATTWLVRWTCLAWPGLAVTACPFDRSATDTLIAQSRHSRLLVLPRDGDGRYEDVAAYSACPTLVVPAHPAGPSDGPVVVGVDIAGNDEAAIEFAFEEAALRRVPLVAVHVWSGVPQADLSPVDPYVYDLPATTRTVDRLLAETLAGWASKYPDVPVERHLSHEPDAARGLLGATAGAGLVVLGTSHTRYSCHLLGTVVRRVLRRTRRPVAIIRLAA